MEGERQHHRCTSEASDAQRRGQIDDAQDCESQTDETKCVVGFGSRFGFGIVNLLHGVTMLTQKPRHPQQVEAVEGLSSAEGGECDSAVCQNGCVLTPLRTARKQWQDGSKLEALDNLGK